MKNVFVQIFIMVFTIIFVLFGINYLYHGKIGNGEGFFEGIGSVMSGTTETPIVSDGINALEDAAYGTPPAVQYVGGAREVGEVVNFKELFEISMDGTSFTAATNENGFAFYFYDVTDLGGTSVVEKLTTEQIEALEEIPAAFIYDTQLSELHFHQNGTYSILVRVYTESGAQYLYECVIPVEAE